MGVLGTIVEIGRTILIFVIVIEVPISAGRMIDGTTVHKGSISSRTVRWLIC